MSANQTVGYRRLAFLAGLDLAHFREPNCEQIEDCCAERYATVCVATGPTSQTSTMVIPALRGGGIFELILRRWERGL